MRAVPPACLAVPVHADLITPRPVLNCAVNVTIRKTLGLYANVRPCVSYAPFIKTHHPKSASVTGRAGPPARSDAERVLLPLPPQWTSSSCARTRRTSTRASSTARRRRSTSASSSSPSQAREGVGRGQLRCQSTHGDACPPPAAGCEKIIRYAFDYARKNGRKRVTCVVKDNIMKLTDGLFYKARGAGEGQG